MNCIIVDLGELLLGMQMLVMEYHVHTWETSSDNNRAIIVKPQQ